MSTNIIKSTIFIGLFASAFNSYNIQAADLDTFQDKSSIVMTQLNIAKKNAMGHLNEKNKVQKIELDGARVKSPAYANKSELQSKIWFTTEEGKQLKWPFIDFYNSHPAALEPAAGSHAPRYAPTPKKYNHYSGKTHSVFKDALPSSYREKDEEPFYAALNFEPTQRPLPRKLSFVK